MTDSAKPTRAIDRDHPGKGPEEAPAKKAPPAEIDIERGDTDEPGKTPTEIPSPTRLPPD